MPAAALSAFAIATCVSTAAYAFNCDGEDSPAPHFDIQTFGANCDGSDDTRAVQAALDALPPGGTLEFSCAAGVKQVSLARRAKVTIVGTNGGGIILLSQTNDVWSRAFAIVRCSGCTIRDLVVEGNQKDIIPFSIEESSETIVSGLTIRNVKHAGAAFLAVHNSGNSYLNNTIENVGMDRSPGAHDTTRGMWIGNVSEASKETNVNISNNKLRDIGGTAIAVHGTGITINGNRGERLNWGCIKVVPLGGAGPSLVANNHCSGAGAKWLIGGGIMTEYYNSSFESTVIRDNVIEGYRAEDVIRIPDSPSVGINIANPVGKTTHNVQIINNTIRNMLYDSIQVSGPADGFLIENNLIDRTIPFGVQWNGINLQGDSGIVIANGMIRRNLIRGKFEGILLSANGGTISGITLESNTITTIARDGLHIEVQNGGSVSNLGLSDLCFSGIGGRSIWDNRPISLRLSDPPPAPSVQQGSAALVSGCSDPRTL